jgi:competence protein CoiA
MKLKFALVEGERREARPLLSGRCDYCGQAMVAKCGPLRAWHWSHRGSRACDLWSEPETEWHRAWKGQFPSDWQEIVQQSENGERHRADVKTKNDVIIEFQHSNLVREEREARETFYQNLVWVIDGLKRVRDRKRFFASLKERSILKANPLTFSLASNEGALLRDWAGNSSPVFFDFGDNPVQLSLGYGFLFFRTSILWRLAPRSPEGKAYVSPVTKASFLNHYLKGLPFEYVDYLAELARLRQASLSRPLMDFERYMAGQGIRLPRF